MRGVFSILGTVGLLCGTWAVPAGAQESGGSYDEDPASPGGHEYAIPLEEERREASPDAAGEPGEVQAPFGEGIEPEDGGGNTDADDQGDSSSGSPSQTGGGSGGSGATGASGGEKPTGAEQTARAAPPPAADRTSSGWLPELSAVAIALAVALAGVTLGLVLRRNHRTT